MSPGAWLALCGVLLFATSLSLAELVLRLLPSRAERLGLVDHPGGRKDHQDAMPLVGGLAIIAAVLIPVVLGLLAAALLPAELAPEPLRGQLPLLLSRTPELAAILGGTLILLVLGALDDRRDLSPWTRLFVQTLCAGLLVLADVRITLHLLPPALQIVATLLFVVFLVNAMNFIDNMNGLMAGSALITATTLLVLAIASDQFFMAAILLCLLGGLLRFFPRNYPKASVFMGDAGTLAVGFLLAALTLAFTFDLEGGAVRPIVLPALLLALPLVDGVWVVVTRLRRGVHPFTAGRDHLSHRLLATGVAPQNVVAWLWAAGLIFATIAGAVADLDARAIPIPAAFVLIVFTVSRLRSPR